jgi:hypothetical protein
MVGSSSLQEQADAYHDGGWQIEDGCALNL